MYGQILDPRLSLALRILEQAHAADDIEVDVVTQEGIKRQGNRLDI